MARKTNVVIKWGVPLIASDKKTAEVFVLRNRAEARATYKSLKDGGIDARRPFKIYVEV